MKLTKLFLFLVLFSSNITVAQEPIQFPQPSSPIVWTDAELKLNERIEPQLYGGRRIKAGELKLSVYIGNCTSTIVGPKTILTAGHCRSSGSTATFTYKGVRHTGRCVQHPQYDQGDWLNNDWALCTFSPEIDLPVWGNLKATEVKVGDIATMQGYGQGSNGVLNVGEAAITRINHMEIITNDRVHLGAGDSGGALFARVNDLVNGPFHVIGVNSRGGGNTSLFNSANLPRSQKFFSDFARDKNVKICGINWDCNQAPPPGCNEAAGMLEHMEAEYNAAKEQYDLCVGRKKL